MTEVSRALDLLAKKRGVLLTFDTSGNLPFIFADRGRLIQVLLNLGTNAIKYNVEGGWVLLTALPYDHVVRFVVRDTGKGIPVDRHAEVFEPFNRLGKELTEEEGTGIELTISRTLAEAMNGTIGFESVVGQGCKFWVDLPITEAKVIKATPSSPLQALAADARCKILYIEDKIPNVELMRAVIGDLSNMQFIDAQTVSDGLKIALSIQPDLVITDIHLPDGKGFDVLKGLRDDPRTAHIPVVALTADAMSSNMENMDRAGFDHILTKPLRIPELMRILRATLRAA